MQDCLQIVSLSRILAVEQLQELQKQQPNSRCSDHSRGVTRGGLRGPTHLKDKLLVYVLFGNAGLEFLTLQEPNEELINQLEGGREDRRMTFYSSSHLDGSLRSHTRRLYL